MLLIPIAAMKACAVYEIKWFERYFEKKCKIIHIVKTNTPKYLLVDQNGLRYNLVWKLGVFD